MSESKTNISGVKIDFHKPHPPLLLTSGSIDNIVPTSLIYRNYKCYKPNNSVLSHKEFEGRNHFAIGQPT